MIRMPNVSFITHLYQYVIQNLQWHTPKPSFYEKAQNEAAFQCYQAWCSETRQIERQLRALLKEKVIHPIDFRNTLLMQQQKPEHAIVSPVYYEQRLTALEKKIQTWRLPSILSDIVREVKARFRGYLQTQPALSQQYFYNDVISQLIELSGRQLLSSKTWLASLGYYQGLVPENIYQKTITYLQQFLKNHPEELHKTDLYKEKFIPASDYETLVANINAIFKLPKSACTNEEKISPKHPFTLTPSSVAMAALAVTGVIAYGYREWGRTEFDLSCNSIQPWTMLAQATVSYGIYSHSLTFPPIVSVAVALFSMPLSNAQITGIRNSLFDLMALNGENGFMAKDKGIGHFDSPPPTVVSSGDINGDGITDLLIGSFYANALRARQSYVVYGSRDPFPANFSLTGLNGVNGFILNSFSYDGDERMSISSGDINGDGIADLLMGIPGDCTSLDGKGQCYVVYGSRDPFPANFNLTSLNGDNGFVIYFDDGDSNYKGCGLGVSIGSGDINGDGILDLLIGAPGARTITSQQGWNYVLYGSRNPFPASFNLQSLNGSNGFMIPGSEWSDDHFGMSTGSGDINGDGISDLLVGAPQANGRDRGQCYVIFGSRYPFSAIFNLMSLNGSNGFIIRGSEYSYFGSSIGSADINGDGIADLLVGAPGNFGGPFYRTEHSYVIFGSRGPFPASFNLADLINGNDGFMVNGVYEGDYLGFSISSGDVNGDGIDDFLLSASAEELSNNPNSRSYAVFGSRKPFPVLLNLTNLDGNNGFIINGNKNKDYAIAYVGSGDINGDGIADFLIGGAGEYIGKSYVIFGKTSSFATSGSTTNLFTTGSVTTGPVTTGDITTTGTSNFGTTGSNSISSSIVNKADKGLIGGIVAGSLMLIICIGGTAFYLYQKRKNRSLSPELQPLLGTADFRDYDTLELSNPQTQAAAILEQEQREELQTEQEEEFHIVAQQILSADKKPHDQPKESGSLQSNPFSMKLYQTSAVKQTFFYAGAKAEQKNELLNIDSPSDAPSHVASSNNLKQ